MARPEHVMALYRHHFPSFLCFAFGELHNGRPAIETPSIDILADHLARNANGEIVLPHGGRRRSATVGRRLRCRDIDLVVVDDPVIPAQIHDAAKLKATSQWFEAEVLQRLNDQSSGAVVIVTRRLHIDDLCGHLLGSNQSWVHLSLPAIAPEDEEWALSDGRIVNRRKGDALAPELADMQQIYWRMREVGAYRFSAEYLQEPFKVLDEEEMRRGCFGGGEDDPDGPQFWLGGVPESDIMAYEMFGVGDRHPAPPPIGFPIEGGPLPVEDVEVD